MKAVILAGGEGTRLRCVTGDVPKPMVSLCGKPMLEHIIALLRKNGFDELCAAVRYRREDIEGYFGDGEKFGVKLQYRIEEEPLGTAGAVKNCADFYQDEDFLVISGDAACDFDLRGLYNWHKSHGGAASIALYRSEAPLRYGLAVTDGAGLVRSFVEKPDWSRVVTDLVNTGIYVLSPRAMDYVPPRQTADFARDLFPRLLDCGESVYARAEEGYWQDVGEPLSYYKCCLDALTGVYPTEIAPEFLPKAAESAPDAAGEEYECADRAALMGRLSRVMLDMGADFSDGIRLHREHYDMHIFPCGAKSAVRVSVRSPDAEFARELAITAGELIKALEKK